jgi:hypothetical protein
LTSAGKSKLVREIFRAATMCKGSILIGSSATSFTAFWVSKMRGAVKGGGSMKVTHKRGWKRVNQRRVHSKRRNSIPLRV